MPSAYSLIKFVHVLLAIIAVGVIVVVIVFFNGHEADTVGHQK
ncbi:MAG: hypothetical protein ACR2FO_00240 [Actinomycetota bacterium]